MGNRTSRLAGALFSALAVGLFGVPGPSDARAQKTGGPGGRAASPGEVRGVVVEGGTGRPVGGATVELTAGPESGGPFRRGATDAGGTYRVRELPPGRYRLKVSKLGYRNFTLWLELPPSWRVRRSVGLALAPIEMDPVRVAGLRGWRSWRAATGAVAFPGEAAANPGPDPRPTLDTRVLTPREVSDLATLGEPDLFRALQRLPGVSGRGDYAAAPWTRGAPWGLTRVLLDGLPLYDPLHLGGAGTALAVEALEGARFLPGAQPAALGEGVAGTLQLTSRRAREEGRVQVGASPVAVRGRVERRWLSGRLGLALTGRRSWWDLLEPLLPAGRVSGSVDYHFADVAGRADLRLGAAWALEIGGLWGEDRLDGDVGDLLASSEGRWGNRSGWLAVERSFGSAGIRATLGRSGYAVRTRPKPWSAFYDRRGIPSLDRLEIDLSRTLLRLEAGGSLGEGGLEWNAGVERDRQGLAQFSMEAWDWGVPGRNGEAVARWSRAWLEGTLRLGALRLATGAALDLPDGIPLTGSPVRPTLRLRWRPVDGVSLEAGRSRQRQYAYPLAPAGRPLGPALRVGHVWVVAGANSPPLASDVTTLGLEVRPVTEVTAGVSLWRREVAGLWMRGVSTVAGDSLRPVSPEGGTGRERAEGAEARVRWTGERVDAEASYTWTRARLEGPEGLVWSAPSERRHSVDAVVGGRVAPGLRARVLFRGESGWPFVRGPWYCNRQQGDPCPPEKLEGRPDEHAFLRGPGYFSLDLRLDWRRRGEDVTWGVTASLRNALGRDNAAAYRGETCDGFELLSAACERAVGPGEFWPGISGPSPTVALTMVF